MSEADLVAVRKSVDRAISRIRSEERLGYETIPIGFAVVIADEVERLREANELQQKLRIMEAPYAPEPADD